MGGRGIRSPECSGFLREPVRPCNGLSGVIVLVTPVKSLSGTPQERFGADTPVFDNVYLTLSLFIPPNRDINGWRDDSGFTSLLVSFVIQEVAYHLTIAHLGNSMCSLSDSIY